MIPDSELVRINSHDEIHAGMTVVIKPCSRCSASQHAMVIMSRTDEGLGAYHGPSMSPCLTGLVFTVYPSPRCSTYAFSNPRKCFCKPIQEGRVYRIEDKKKAQDLQEIRRLECEADSIAKAAQIIVGSKGWWGLKAHLPKPSPGQS